MNAADGPERMAARATLKKGLRGLDPVCSACGTELPFCDSFRHCPDC